MNKVDVIGVVTELHEQIGWALQALKQNEPPSCGHTLTPTGEAIADMSARLSALENSNQFHETIRGIVSGQNERIVALQKRVTELQNSNDVLQERMKNLENFGPTGKPAPEPSVPVSELRAIVRENVKLGVGFHEWTDKINMAIAKAEGGAK